MKQTVRFLFIIVGFLVFTSSWAAFTDFNGKPHQLADYTGKGKWTIVMFWASDCRVCNAEIGQYIQFYQDHNDKDATILGISLDGQAKLDAARDFVKRHGVPFPNLIGEPEQTADLYQTLTSTAWVGTPSFLVYDPQGQLLAAQAGAVPTELIEKFIAEKNKKADKSQ